MSRLADTKLQDLIQPEGFPCSCGRIHCALPLKYADVAPGCLKDLPSVLNRLGFSRPFIVMDGNTRRAAGDAALSLIRQEGISSDVFCFPEGMDILPNEEGMAMLVEALPPGCDFILGIGSGVINDLCKITAFNRGMECGIVATAPSMDGYASNSSAMELKGVKTTVYTVCPSIVLCDTEIMRHAPLRMLQSGFADMAAKMISIPDWKIASLITGEYYCEEIASLMTRACVNVLDAAEQIQSRDGEAVRSLSEGLVLSGLASSFAGVSRPASGMEHTVSHLLEMFAIARGMRPAPHGIQVGYGTRIALKLYREAVTFEPSKELAEAACASFDASSWRAEMHRVFGDQADGLIELAEAEGRNEPGAVLARADAALRRWPEIKEIIIDTLAWEDRLTKGLDLMGIPQINEPQQMGYSTEEAGNAVLRSPDLRSRYIFTSMCRDIALPGFSKPLFPE